MYVELCVGNWNTCIHTHVYVCVGKGAYACVHPLKMILHFNCAANFSSFFFQRSRIYIYRRRSVYSADLIYIVIKKLVYYDPITSG